MGRYANVIQILDDLVGGPGAAVGGPHKDFWRGKTRDDFVVLSIPAFGQSLPLLEVGDGAASNLVKALKGETPFGRGLPSSPPSARYRRMPSGLDPASDNNIAFIQEWIDDGCPDQ